MLVVFSFLACAHDDDVLQKQDEVCSAGSVSDEVDPGVSLDTALSALQAAPPTVHADWADINEIGAAADDVVLTPVSFSGTATVCSVDAVPTYAYATATVDVASSVWLPSGEYDFEVKVYAEDMTGGNAIRLNAEPMEFSLPEDYRTAAEPVVEAYVGRDVAAEEVPSTAYLNVGGNLYAGGSEDGQAGWEAAVFFDYDQVVDLTVEGASLGEDGVPLAK